MRIGWGFLDPHGNSSVPEKLVPHKILYSCTEEYFYEVLMKQIYVYETGYSKTLVKTVNEVKYSNFKKIGETANNIDERIRSQFIGVPHDPDEKLYTLLYTTDAVNKYGENFSDKYIHEYLKHKGYYNIPESEWFSLSLNDIIKEINELKEHKFTHLNAAERNILELLKNSAPLNTIEIGEALNRPSNYIQGCIQTLWKNKLVSRSKKFDSTLNKMRFYYSTEEKQVFKDVPSYKMLSKRNNKFLYELNLSLEEITDIIKDCSIKEGTEKLCKITGFTFSTIEKFLSELRKELEYQNLITYEISTGYRNTSKIIRKL